MNQQPSSALSASPTNTPCAVVIADDLTGACDAGVEFAKRGLVTHVGMGSIPSLPCDVLAVNAHTRELESRQAAQRMASLASQTPPGAPMIFRKIDSAMRGNIVSECDALMDCLGIPFGVLAPSLPRQGRTVLDGILHIQDISGTRTVDIANLLQGQGASIRLLPASEDPERLRQVIEDAGDSGARYILCDAVTDADLQVVADAIGTCQVRPMWIGSAGLAAQAAARLRPSTLSTKASATSWNRADSTTLFCVGSIHPVTSLQLEHLCTTRRIAIVDAAETSPEQLRRSLSVGGIVVLKIHGPALSSERLTQCLQSAADSGVSRILMSGGDTAELLCRTAQTDHLLLRGEVVPGVPESMMQGGLFDGTLLATKSGGFGQENCLSEILCAGLTTPLLAVGKEEA